MAMPATLTEQLPEYLLSAPLCSQCKTKMRLERVEPDRSGSKDVSVYSCPTCGLADRIESKRE